MIKHIVCWQLIEENKLENALAIKTVLEDLNGKIDGLITIEVGINTPNTPANNWDIVLYSEFESLEALNNYQVHALHKAAGAIIKPLTTNRVCVDYEV